MHTILFDNAPSDWNEALPLGNGVFGAMAFYRDGAYRLALNHYEVYYQSHHRYSHAFLEEGGEEPGGEDSYAAMLRRARLSLEAETGEGYQNYRRTIWPEADTPKQTGLTAGASQPPTGELAFSFAPELACPESHRLWLEIEKATVRLELEGRGCSLSAKTRVLAGNDVVLTQITQSQPGLLREICLTYPQRRGHEGYHWEFSALGEGAFLCRVSFYPQGENREKYPPFSFVTLHRLLGAAGELCVQGNRAKIRLHNDAESLTLLSCAVTQLSAGPNLVASATALLQEVQENLPRHIVAHEQHWASFFGRSAVSLPDAVLERLWYLNLYVLGCCSGQNGRRKEQASGLNGLWDICQPTLWGSLWYWDVNIQATYWPVYTANHLELARVFNEGFLSYMEAGRRRAREWYGKEGYAIDYPHPFYNCIGPWCAQYLWWYYEYSGDLAFLREKAYPMFREQIRFVADMAKEDPESGRLVFFPDVSPEQGPITQNSTITLATVKYLLQIGLKANRLLGESGEDAALFAGLLEKMPPYATATLSRYGRVLKDSYLAPEGIRLRHPSLLMPIYPLWELGADSDPQTRQLAENTLYFAAEHTELGVFSFGWISAAAARLGLGGMALRVLYQQGLDLIMRANGMGAEETDRWLNHCVVRRSALNHPFMMECVGEVVACVNEMLLQSHGGLIRVFPAVPRGEAEPRLEAGREQAGTPKDHAPAKWESCAFEGLLARGGFEVSAAMEKGRVCWIGIKSTRGGEARLLMPQSLRGCALVGAAGEEVPAEEGQGILSFPTTEGGFYQIGQRPKAATGEDRGVLRYTTHLGRQAYIGKNRLTEVMKKLDSFLCDYYVANDRCRPVIAWRFNFGLPLGAAKAARPSPEELMFMKITPQQRYTPFYGFGFEEGGLEAAQLAQAGQAGQAHYLLRDCVQGEEAAAFLVELPKGRYDILAVAGGAPGISRISAGGAVAQLCCAPGEYEAGVLPIVHERDGIVRVALDTNGGCRWSLCALVIRKIAAYL